MPSVMLSYSHRDEDLCRALSSALTACGVRTQAAPDFISGGDHFPQKIAETIARVDFVIFLFTPDAAASAWVRAEYEQASSESDGRTAGARVIPLAAECRWAPNTSIPPWAAHRHHIRLRSEEGSSRESWCAELMQALGHTAPEPVLLSARESVDRALRAWCRRRAAAVFARTMLALTFLGSTGILGTSVYNAERAREDAVALVFDAAALLASDAITIEGAQRSALERRFQQSCAALKDSGSTRTLAHLDAFKTLFRDCIDRPHPDCEQEVRGAAQVVDNEARCERCPSLFQGRVCGMGCQ